MSTVTPVRYLIELDNKPVVAKCDECGRHDEYMQYVFDDIIDGEETYVPYCNMCYKLLD